MSALSRFEVKDGYLRAPIRINYRVTNECNQFCKHCWPDSGSKKFQELDTAQAITALDRIVDFGALMFTINGGEPMLRPDIDKILEHLSKKNVWFEMTSSGWGITKEWATFFSKIHIKRISISLEGSNKDLHRVLRPLEDSFETALGALELLGEYDITTGVCTTVTALNYKHIPVMCNFLKARNIKSWSLTVLLALGRGKNLNNLILSKEQLLEFFEIVNKCKSEYPEMEIQLHDPLYSKYVGESYGSNQFPTCQAGRAELSILPNGDLIPCRYMSSMVFGNIITDDIAELWCNSPVLKTLRDIKLDNTCKECESYSQCLGGCRARAINQGLPVDSPDPQCLELL
ncbi:MAG TPA: radical SAM protein [Clostridia bacterium]|nr:radical SAM protein [Clostridia bacterium]